MFTQGCHLHREGYYTSCGSHCGGTLAASLDTMIRHTILDDATLSSSHLLPTYIDTFSKISAFDVDYKNTFHVQRAHSKTVLAKSWYFSNTYLLTTMVAQNFKKKPFITGFQGV